PSHTAVPGVDSEGLARGSPGYRLCAAYPSWFGRWIRPAVLAHGRNLGPALPAPDGRPADCLPGAGGPLRSISVEEDNSAARLSVLGAVCFLSRHLLRISQPAYGRNSVYGTNPDSGAASTRQRVEPDPLSLQAAGAVGAWRSARSR